MLTKVFIIILLLVCIAGGLILKVKLIYKVLIFSLLTLIIPFVSIQIGNKISSKQTLQQNDQSTIVILGAGIYNNDTPTDILKKRLETGAEIYNLTNQKIIVTGDNSVTWHNEPRVMKNYLMKLDVNPNDITEDFGGRRTMDSCYRVKNYFNATNIVVVSQAFHLPRAKFLCESIGLNVQTKAAQDAGFNSTLWGYLREIPASWAAFVDSVYFQPQVASNGREWVK